MPYLFFFRGKLILSIAVSTTDRQASWLAAFLQAEDWPMFKDLKSDSTTRNQVCLGRPAGRLQSGGGFRIAAETARWWSWMGKLLYIHYSIHFVISSVSWHLWWMRGRPVKSIALAVPIGGLWGLWEKWHNLEIPVKNEPVEQKPKVVISANVL